MRGKGSVAALVTHEGFIAVTPPELCKLEKQHFPGFRDWKMSVDAMFIKYLITARRLCHYLSIGEWLKA